MRFTKIPVIAASAALCLVACSENSSVANPNVDPSLSDIVNPGGPQPDNGGLGSDVPGIENPGSELPGDVLPGTENPGSEVPGTENPGDVVPGVSSSSDVNFGISSSSNAFPGMISSSSVIPGNDDSEEGQTGSEVMMRLAGTTATVENNNGCVTVAEKSATITCPGAYYVSGESSDFQVVVNTPGTKDEGNTGIYLNNATLKSQNAAIFVKNADKAVLHLVKGSTNVVEDGNGNHLYQKADGSQDTAKAAIYSKDDLNIKGAGKLTVKGNFAGGIHCSNDLKIKNGDITISAKGNAIKGKESLEISGGNLSITATGKGLVSDTTISVGGNLKLETEDDGIHSNYTVTMDSGVVSISTKGKGIHADSSLYLKGSTVNIITAKEGLESYEIFAEGGITSTFATDDGWNAAGGPKDPNAGGMSAFSESGGRMVISGGYHYISAKGSMIDVLDANGTAKQTGGVLILEITGESYENGMGGFGGGNMGGGNFGGWGGNQGGNFGGGMSFGGGGCSSNMAGGLIDTDSGFEISDGAVLLAFGNYSTDIPECSAVEYTSDNFYGSDAAAFKPQYKGSTILYGGAVKSVGQVQTAGMKELKFPNGLVYMYK